MWMQTENKAFVQIHMTQKHNTHTHTDICKYLNHANILA